MLQEWTWRCLHQSRESLLLCRWLRDGLEVRQEELSNPYKVVKRRGVKEAPGPPARGSHPPADQEEEVQQELSVVPVPDALVTKMYGQWQTQQWEVPTAVDGAVPKNDRGNVHCPPLASELPKVGSLSLRPEDNACAMFQLFSSTL